MVPENWHVCVNKGIAYLLTYFSSLRKNIGLFDNCEVHILMTLRAAFKFGCRVHVNLRRNMLKPPIARLPAI